MRSKVYELLFQNRDKSISGEKISDMLGISRAAVWKHISAIKADGAIIESINNKGYLLISLPDKLKKEYVMPFLKQDYKNIDIKWMESVDSTNVFAKRNAVGNIKSFIVFSETQTAGKGRRGRTWESPKGNIYMSFLLRTDLAPDKISGITLAAAMGVCDAIKSYASIVSQIKWPNDIIINAKKVCGILTEMCAEEDSVEYIVIGIGINTNAVMGYSDEVEDKCISLKEASGVKIDRPELAGTVINCVLARTEEYEKFGLSKMIDEYTKRSCMMGKELVIDSRDGKKTGTAQGFSEDGMLIFKDDSGEILKIRAGEVSVRGINGYI